MLAITADGRKLPPYVIFKRKTMPKAKCMYEARVGWMQL
jgi:hypothetical protein